MEIAILVSAVLAVVLNIVIILLIVLRHDPEQMIGQSEKRITDDIENLQQGQSREISDLKAAVVETKGQISEKVTERMQGIREEMAGQLLAINERLEKNVRDNYEGQEKINSRLSESLLRLQTMTEEKLNGIQKDVNEKLDASLNKRLEESFDKVTTQLGQLYKSLGELGEMSDGIASLNKTLTNVKTRGTWGEMQLGSILAETMTPAQYESNVKVKKNSDDLVEFAIRIPSREREDEVVYLPVDSKFPLDIYGQVADAAVSGDPARYDKARKELERRIKDEAKTIRDKYIAPPVTTDFALMFLPTESLYAEVLRIDGLAEFCQNKYRVILSGPTTITALLNSLRVGFANIAINKKTSEVQHLLEAVKAQYGKLDEIIDKTKKQLETAVKSTDELKNRTSMIRRKMSKVVEIDVAESDALLMGDADE